MIDAARFRQIDALFAAALERPTGERGDFLDDACVGDPELRSAVGELLAHDEGASAAIREVVEAAALQDAIRRIGPYRVVREIGAGGMGVVYLAVRDDPHFHTEVAVKVLQGGLESAQAIARFRDERQILATLRHSGIVQLLDGGSLADGLPYLVMEYVEGSPITRWADARGLDVRARVELFQQVCAAVSYAHQKLVVHRDLKPSNILVTAAGAPKLLDFGIAKLLDPSASLAREAQTRAGMLFLTPEYASPEQLEGQPVSTASDLFSLGAVLYELLVGAPPRRLEGGGLAALTRALEVEIPRPSEVAPPSRRRAIAGDLERVVLKALEREPDRRYPSVERFSRDLGRALAGEPVEAHASTFVYRARKLLRRHRGAVLALAAVLLSLAGATVISTRQALRADEQARRAEQRTEDVRRLASAMLFEIDGELQEVEGATAARELLVRRSLAFLDVLAREADEGDPEQLLELAAGYLKIGDIQGSPTAPNLGHPSDALASYARAMELLQRSSVRDLPAARWQRATTRHRIGVLQVEIGEVAAGHTNLREALADVDGLPRSEDDHHRLVAFLRAALIQVAIDDGDLAAAAGHSDALLAVGARWEAAAGSHEARFWVGVAHEAASLWQSYAADPRAALAELDLALAVFRRLIDEAPQNVMFRRELWSALLRASAFHSGRDLRDLPVAHTGDLEAAEALLREALEIAERLARSDLLDTRAAQELALTLDLLAALVDARDPAAAAELFARASSIFAGLPAAVRDSASVRQLIAAGRCLAGVTLARLGRGDEAGQELAVGLDLAAQEAAVAHATVDVLILPAMCGVEAARARLALGDEEAAASLLEGAAADLRPLIDARPGLFPLRHGRADALTRLAALRVDACGSLLDAALATWRGWPGAPTEYTRAGEASIVAARAKCRTPEGPAR
ncbi:MAG: serine/threonine-protein kinase [Nannocystaceae bacterium]